MKTQEQDSKKAYQAPLAEPVALDDEALDAAAGGEGESDSEIEQFSETAVRRDGTGTGIGKGGGCQQFDHHRGARTYSSGRNAWCT